MRLFAMLELVVCTCVASGCAAGSATDDDGGDHRDDSVVEAEADPEVVVRPRREPARDPDRSIDPFGPPPPSPVEHVDEQESAPISTPPRPRR